MKKLVLVTTLMLAACSPAPEPEAEPSESAAEFVERVNREYLDLFTEVGAIWWLRATHISYDTGLLAARAEEKWARWKTEVAEGSMKFEGREMTAETARALQILRRDTSMPAPRDPGKRKELARLITDMEGLYGTGKWCSEAGECIPGTELEERMATVRDPDELLAMWQGWREVSIPMRSQYERFVELTNEGARELGFADTGDMWRSGYDMDSAAFRLEADRLWQQVSPLYDQLHCHVRAELSEQYGRERVPPDQPVPAHLLGNMWAQTWDRVYDLVEPYPGVSQVDVTPTLMTGNHTPKEMVRSAESFYTSLGFAPLPDSFWERSLFTKPQDREVQCHASAWTLAGEPDDVRIKMCIKQTHEELGVIYHELGHVYYNRTYAHLPVVFREGAHDGFHEAIGDAIVLAMTPDYLNEVGLLGEQVQSNEALINQQMRTALERIAILPWARLVDEWRWGVFSGEIAPQQYNQAWWDLRTRYQGVASPVPRDESHFDPGAKYHIPANTPYARYFLAGILQFQFYQALCDISGHEGPLHQCSFYQSKEAGERFQAMMAHGSSQSWQDTLQELTGSRSMDGSALFTYFEPLMGWLKEQNQGRQCGW